MDEKIIWNFNRMLLLREKIKLFLPSPVVVLRTECFVSIFSGVFFATKQCFSVVADLVFIKWNFLVLVDLDVVVSFCWVTNEKLVWNFNLMLLFCEKKYNSFLIVVKIRETSNLKFQSYVAFRREEIQLLPSLSVVKFWISCILGFFGDQMVLLKSQL